MTFGEKIQKLRKEAGLSQEEFAYQLGVSRQAVSKWERDSGYPETEKIIRMSKMFHVTLDYLLNEEEEDRSKPSPEEPGFYVSLETARGFLAHQKRKLQKTGAAAGLFIGSLAFSFSNQNSNLGVLVFMLLFITEIILLFSILLAGNPYRRLWREPLLFDKTVKEKLTTLYEERRKKAVALDLLGIALIALGFLFFPLLIPAELSTPDDLVLVFGMLLAGAGADSVRSCADPGCRRLEAGRASAKWRANRRLYSFTGKGHKIRRNTNRWKAV